MSAFQDAVAAAKKAKREGVAKLKATPKKPKKKAKPAEEEAAE